MIKEKNLRITGIMMAVCPNNCFIFLEIVLEHFISYLAENSSKKYEILKALNILIMTSEL